MTTGYVQDLELSDDVIGLRCGNKRWVLPTGLGAHVGQPVCRFSAKPNQQDLEESLKRCDDLETAFLAEERAAPAETVIPALILS